MTGTIYINVMPEKVITTGGIDYQAIQCDALNYEIFYIEVRELKCFHPG
jgi:hypothetical protein